MSNVDFIYTDHPLKKLEYTLDDMFGEYEIKWWSSIDNSPVTGIKFSEGELQGSEEEVAGSLFLELIRYRVIKSGSVDFQYHKHHPENVKYASRASLNWLLNFIRRHLRGGTKKFYYAHLPVPFDSGSKKHVMKKIDLAKFNPKDKEFEFGYNTIWEFFDSSLNM